MMMMISYLKTLSNKKKKGNCKKDSASNCLKATPPKKTRKKETPKQANKSVTGSKKKGDVIPAESETKESRTGDSDDDDDNSQFVIDPQSIEDIESEAESDDFDPFAANYRANINLAQCAAEAEDHELEKELEQQKQKELEQLQKLEDKKKEEEDLLVIDEAEKSDVIIIDDDIKKYRKRGRRNTRKAKHETTAPDCEIIPTESRQLKTISRKTQAALKHFDKIADRLDNDSFNLSLSSDILEVEEDEDADITLRLKKGRTYFKHTMDKNKKFSMLFQKMAEKYKVSINQIFLTLNNEYLDPEKTPKDLGITLADVIELGVMSAEEDTEAPTTSSDVNSISFRVQTSNRKGSITVTINRYDKMQVLMNKYAKEKGTAVSDLRFNFDGEALEPDETPITLEMEGGECIDVFPKK